MQSDDKGTTLEVEVPGVQKDNLSIEVNNRILTISGKRLFYTSEYQEPEGPSDQVKETSQQTNESERKERLTYLLKMRLGTDADVDNISCVSYKDGILALRVPVSEKESVRKITLVD